MAERTSNEEPRAFAQEEVINERLALTHQLLGDSAMIAAAVKVSGRSEAEIQRYFAGLAGIERRNSEQYVVVSDDPTLLGFRLSADEIANSPRLQEAMAQADRGELTPWPERID